MHFDSISPKFVSNGPIDETSASVEVKASCRLGDKPLPEPMMTLSIDIKFVFSFAQFTDFDVML